VAHGPEALADLLKAARKPKKPRAKAKAKAAPGSPGSPDSPYFFRGGKTWAWRCDKDGNDTSYHLAWAGLLGAGARQGEEIAAYDPVRRF
jgi:hypothetical protein